MRVTLAIYGGATCGEISFVRLQNTIYGGQKIRLSSYEILQYYGMERFLYRLSKTSHVNDLILKGGLMFYGLEIPMRRTTRNIDFLGVSENAQRDILSVFHDALSVSFAEDGVHFDTKTLRLSQTQAEANQDGIRITFIGIWAK